MNENSIGVPFADFVPMHHELRAELDAAYSRVVDLSWFIKGEEVRLFENEFANYCNANYCVGVANGLDALYLILRAMGIGAGDEVIIPSNTFIATALAVSYAGAKPVLVEPNISDYNIDTSLIEDKITKKTKAIIAVHLQGRPANMHIINEIAKKNSLFVIEDAAQAHGARLDGRKVGVFSDASAFSFYPGKNIGALGDGGCVVTNNKDIADKVRALGNYGSEGKYNHIYQGCNSRLDELQAAFLRVKLKYLDRWNEYRRGVAEKYFEGICADHLVLPPKSNEEYEHIYHIFAIRCEQRDDLAEYLAKKNIKTVIHYPIPIHLQKAYSELKIKEGCLPVAEEISRSELSIPMYYGISDEQVNYVIDAINTYTKKWK